MPNILYIHKAPFKKPNIWTADILEKLLGAQLVKKFPEVYGT
jgi:hypothetical protein